MAQYRDLNAPPRQTFADIVAEMRDQAKSSKTGSAGVKDLGEYGDVVWSRPGGAPVSVRDVDLELGDARQRIEDAEADVLAAQARINIALDAEGHIREDEILRNATLIGDTVVDNINVVGKLVGTDGVFTGTVDFENINVTDEVLAARISGEHIYGTVIEGGLFKTSDSMPGRVEFADDAYIPSWAPTPTALPGFRITPVDTSNVSIPPGLGMNRDGVVLDGGKSTSGQSSYISASPSGTSILTNHTNNVLASEIVTNSSQASLLVNGNDGFARSSISANPVSANMATYWSGSNRVRALVNVIQGGATLSSQSQESGALPLAEAGVNGQQAFLKTRLGGSERSLLVDNQGVWAKQGTDQVSLVPEVRAFQYSALWNADLSPAHIMVQHLPGGKLCQAQIRIQNLSGSSLSLPYDSWVTLNYNPIPSDLRGGYTDYIEVTLPQLNARGRVEMNYSTGSIRIKSLEKDVTISWTNNNSIWFPMRWFSPN